MFRQFDNRWGHYLLLLVATTALFLPNLGGPSLWDIDEGNNAEAAREMLASGNWIVPTFNYQLRVDKPALLYWCQIGAYRAFGVGEFAARLPSALAAMIAVLLTYELGRSMFGPASGLLAGIILASAGLFCAVAHFANPDMLLNASTVLSFFVFWRSFVSGSRSWFGWIGVSTGLGFLAKGPVALVLPVAVILLFLLWARQLRRLLDSRLLVGGVLFAVVALPWYALVGAETRGEFLRGFFLQHNQQRFLAPMEGHYGPIYYHVISLLIGFVPWSAFLAPTLYYAIRHTTHHSPLTTCPSP
ncbi:MAG TPA: glycosyltransferase family 39 protein, partial [Gemmataceae bacterium]|nr:glycosyltransferase family 39 protein [Gemmataceae bacterium]